MQAKKNDPTRQFHLRAKLPKIFGVGALALLVITLAAIVFSIYRGGSKPEFRMQGFPTSLSKDVIATVDGYERRETDGEKLKYYIKADRAVSFADNHQELENVFLEVYSDDGTASDRIAAQKAVYVPAENKNFTAYFSGAVDIQTRDSLHVKTDQLTYTRENETATAEELVEFTRLNVEGSSTGAIVRIREKTLELQNKVNIRANGEAGAETSTLIAGNAFYDQGNERLDLGDTVSIAVASTGRSSTLDSGRAVAFFSGEAEQDRAVNRVELFDAVKISTRDGENSPTVITSGYAFYQKPIERFDLKHAVHIITAESDQPTDIHSDHAVYEQPQGRVNLSGNATISQKSSYVQGGSIYAELDQARKLKLAEVRDGALVKQTTAERTTEVSGGLVKAFFNPDQSMSKAVVAGAGNAALVPANPAEYTKLTLTAQRSINVDFKGEGLLSQILTDGRTNVKMDVPNNSPDAAGKSLAANTVRTSFAPDGKSILATAASGDAELIVTPLNNSETNYKTVVNAPNFDCEFFPAGNDPKICVASAKTKTVRTPTLPSAGRGTQNITADKLVAGFDPDSKGLEVLEAIGNSKFTELDRNAVSDRIIYTTADQTVKMRGGDPNVWDGNARAKAPEIDWNTKDQYSELRGGASTTYYSPQSTGGAAPFGKSGKPVYVTAQNARFDHRSDVAVFTGNARGWQDKNYVRGERMTISERDGKFIAEDNVQSLMHDAKRRENGVDVNQPIFVAAQKLTYNRENRLMRYENAVDIRQGKDRITGGAANIYLTADNEPSRTEIERNVVIVQPNRRAQGDFARYDSNTETIFLQGNPAVVEDAEQGRSQAAQFTVNLKDNRLASDGSPKQNTAGRVRSVYKIKEQ